MIINQQDKVKTLFLFILRSGKINNNVMYATFIKMENDNLNRVFIDLFNDLNMDLK